MSITGEAGIASSGHFFLEIEMLPTDKISYERRAKFMRKRHMVRPVDGRPGMELIQESRWLKPCTAVGLIRCSKSDLCIYKWFMRAYKGSGRKWATSLGTKGVF